MTGELEQTVLIVMTAEWKHADCNVVTAEQEHAV